MAIDVSYRDTFTTSAEDLARTNRNFIINEGVAFDGLKVTQSLTPAMTVAVATGTGYFYGSGTNANVMYEFYSDATETVTIGTAGVQARIDIICLKVDASTGVASIVAVAGTPSGSPAVPATPASHYKLAEVAVGAGVTSITNANITDRRRSVFVAPTGARNQGLINGYIITSVAGNNLTVSVSTDKNTVIAPTATNPVGVWVGGNLRWITSALSFTRNGGTSSLNMGSTELATREVDLFPYLQWNTTTQTLNLLASRIDNARKMSGFVNSATDEKGVLGIVNYNSNDDVVLVDRFSTTSNSSNNFTATGNIYGEPTRGTRWLTYTPIVSGSGSMTLSVGTITLARYKIENGICFIQLQGDNYTTGGTTSNFIRASLPISQNSAMLGNFRYGATYFVNNGANMVGQYGFGTTGVVEFGKQDVSNLALGTGYYFGVISQYEI
jgi:hypothetical protein